MEAKDLEDFMSMVSSIAGGMRALKPAADAISRGGIFSSARRRNLELLQEKIVSLENEAVSLEEQVNTLFPQLTQLIRSYSRLMADVRAARAVSEKAIELIRIIPNLIPSYAPIFTTQIQSDFTRIDSGTTQLPSVDNVEKGQIAEKLSVIRDRTRDLRQTDEDDIQRLRNIFDDISTYYSDVESILLSFLEKILDSLDPSKNQ